MGLQETPVAPACGLRRAVSVTSLRHLAAASGSAATSQPEQAAPLGPSGCLARGWGLTPASLQDCGFPFHSPPALLPCAWCLPGRQTAPWHSWHVSVQVPYGSHLAAEQDWGEQEVEELEEVEAEEEGEEEQMEEQE